MILTSEVVSTAPFWSGFTAFDWLICVLLLWSVTRAFLRGAIRELLALAGLIVGMLLASWNYAALAPRLEPWLKERPLADAVAFLLILSVILVACSLLGRLLRSGAHAIGLGLFDRFAGAVLGLARGVLAGVAVMLIFTAFLPPQQAIAQSRLAPYLLAAAHGVSFVVPQALRRQVTLGAAALMHTRASWIKPMPGYDNEGSKQDPE